jgi:dihydroorotate dehydrogenase subfamily 1
MEEYNKDRWQEITERTQETGVDAFELNFSCPHGLPERKMGAAMGQNIDIVREVTGWVKEVSKIPVWAKMTPNITDISVPSVAAVEGGADGISAINTILCVIGVNIRGKNKGHPQPTVEGYTVPGGYSGQAVRPIALRQVMEIARALPDTPISGMGGIETWEDAVQFLMMGSTTLQICTGAMLQGYEMIEGLCEGLSNYMDEEGYESIDDMIGLALPWFSTHADLVERQQAAKREKAGKADRDSTLWQGDIAKETASLAADD